MKILIVEDEKKIAQAVAKGLSKFGMSVDLAFDGEEGLDLASSGDYSVIILDVMLPLLDGIEVCKRLRAMGVKTPVLMLTARAEIDDRVLGLDVGADDYLVKPFSFSELVARIKALMRRPMVFSENVKKYKDLVVDINTSKVTRAGDVVKLSKKEYQILSLLVSSPGRVFSKDEIISSVWEFTSETLPSTIEVHIRSLRKKIDEPYPEKLIHTVWGFGYKLSDSK